MPAKRGEVSVKHVAASKPVVFAGVLLILLVVSLAIWNHRLASNRELHLVNGFDVPVVLQLDQWPEVALEPHRGVKLDLAEGRHFAKVSYAGQTLAEGAFEVSTPYLSRWWLRPLFIYNAGGGAPIVWEEVVYAEKLTDGGETRVSLNPGLNAFDHVDYVFQEFPSSLEGLGGQRLVRTRVSVAPLTTDQVLLLPPEMASLDDKLAYVERHMRLGDDSKFMLQSYVSAAAAANKLDRAKMFIAAGLDETPLKIEWHRMAEMLAQAPVEREALRLRYKQLIAEDSENAIACYLLGRMEPIEAAIALYDRAIEIDSEAYDPWLAKGDLLRSMGDFAAARTCYERAVELEPDDQELYGYFLDVRYALGEFAELEAEVREELRLDSARLDMHLRLVGVLYAQNKVDEARQVNEEYVARARAESKDFPAQTVGLCYGAQHYLERDFAQVLEDSQTYPLAGGEARMRYQAQLELGQLDEAGKSLLAAGGDGFDMLQLGVAWRLAGHEAQAREWQARAIQQLNAGGDQHQLAAKLVTEPASVSRSDVQHVLLEPANKVALSLAIAQQQPRGKREELLSLAERMNYTLGALCYFRESAIKALKAK